MYSGYAWMRSNVITSWCLHVTPSHQEVLQDVALFRVSTRLRWIWFLLTSRSVRRCVATCHARARCFSVSSFVDICTSLRSRVPCDGAGLSMETVWDSSRRHVPESLSWRMATGWWWIHTRPLWELSKDSSLRVICVPIIWHFNLWRTMAFTQICPRVCFRDTIFAKIITDLTWCRFMVFELI